MVPNSAYPSYFPAFIIRKTISITLRLLHSDSIDLMQNVQVRYFMPKAKKTDIGPVVLNYLTLERHNLK